QLYVKRKKGENPHSLKAFFKMSFLIQYIHLLQYSLRNSKLIKKFKIDFLVKKKTPSVKQRSLYLLAILD
ncbi:hypothetical protein, partial [Klebsiella pneumoniae]|uniref:hypothetical protein n=1 Tax=Klebsiella pneumoniae TaxID=573 RepID=UPI002108E6DA